MGRGHASFAVACRGNVRRRGLAIELATETPPFAHPLNDRFLCCAHPCLHANVNNLTNSNDVDPLGGMAHYSGVPIEIEPVVDASEPGTSEAPPSR